MRVHSGYYRELAVDCCKAVGMLAIVLGLVTWPFLVAGFLSAAM